MATTRERIGKQLAVSPAISSIMVSDTASEASWLAPTTGQNSGVYYKHATTS